MNSLTSIVAVGLDGAIGVENRLPWRLRSDLRFFKNTTKTNAIIMGRKTYDSLGSCLPHRENIVLSHTPSLFPPHEGCHHVHSIAEALSLREKWPCKKAYVIGGAQTYAQFAPYVDQYLVTVVHARFPHADAFLDQTIFGDDSVWDKEEIEVERIGTSGADEYDFQIFSLTHKDASSVENRRKQLVDEFRKRNHLQRPKQKRPAARGTPAAQSLSLFA